MLASWFTCMLKLIGTTYLNCLAIWFMHANHIATYLLSLRGIFCKMITINDRPAWRMLSPMTLMVVQPATLQPSLPWLLLGPLHGFLPVIDYFAPVCWASFSPPFQWFWQLHRSSKLLHIRQQLFAHAHPKMCEIRLHGQNFLHVI